VQAAKAKAADGANRISLRTGKLSGNLENFGQFKLVLAIPEIILNSNSKVMEAISLINSEQGILHARTGKSFAWNRE
jgi:hypothetical protein